MELAPLNHRIQRGADTSPSCPGGIGNFGFNSYDLLTFSILVMGAVSSAVIVNTNKNENNDNNNDLQASFGDINTNNQMASADQTSTNMAMITVKKLPSTKNYFILKVNKERCLIIPLYSLCSLFLFPCKKDTC